MFNVEPVIFYFYRKSKQNLGFETEFVILTNAGKKVLVSIPADWDRTYEAAEQGCVEGHRALDNSDTGQFLGIFAGPV